MNPLQEILFCFYGRLKVLKNIYRFGFYGVGFLCKTNAIMPAMVIKKMTIVPKRILLPVSEVALPGVTI